MMKVAIIALILSIAALGLGSFATFTALDNEESNPTVEQFWSTAECQRANASLETLDIGCIQGDCAPYADMLQVINDNCP